MTGELVIRLGAYPEIDVYEFKEWCLNKYFKKPNDELFLDKFDLDIEFRIDEEYSRIFVYADLIDYSDVRNGMSETLKREIREVNRGMKK